MEDLEEGFSLEEFWMKLGKTMLIPPFPVLPSCTALVYTRADTIHHTIRHI